MDATPFSTRHFTSATAARRPGPDQGRPRPDATGPAPAAGERALVLGGGGAVGNAWVIGVVAGLADAGLEVTGAELVIGTSSGSTAAAQLTGTTPAGLFAATVAATPRPRTGPVDPGAGRTGPAVDHMERTGRIIRAADDPADMRRRLGAAALELDAASDGSADARWRAVVAGRLPGVRWPERALWITAVDARTGDPVVFDRHSGVDLVDAVAASCASGVPHGIAGSRFIDGGYRRSSENADLAAGYGRVLVLSPLGGRSRAPRAWGMHLAAQVDELRARGSRVETVLPDDGSLEAFGGDMMDLSARPSAARAGAAQGSALAGRLTGFWS